MIPTRDEEAEVARLAAERAERPDARPIILPPRAPWALWAGLALGTLLIATYARVYAPSHDPRPAFVALPSDDLEVIPVDSIGLAMRIDVRAAQGEKIWRFNSVQSGSSETPMTRAAITDRITRFLLAGLRRLPPGPTGIMVKTDEREPVVYEYPTVDLPPGGPTADTEREVRGIVAGFVKDLPENEPYRTYMGGPDGVTDLPMGVAVRVSGRREWEVGESRPRFLPVPTSGLEQDLSRALARYAEVDYLRKWGFAPSYLRRNPERPLSKGYEFTVETWDGREFTATVPSALVQLGVGRTTERLRPFAREVARHLEEWNP